MPVWRFTSNVQVSRYKYKLVPVLLAHIGNTTRTYESSKGQRKILGAGGASTFRDNFPISHNILDPSVPQQQAAKA